MSRRRSNEWTSDMTPRQLSREEIEEKDRKREIQDKIYLKMLNGPVEEQIAFLRKNAIVKP